LENDLAGYFVTFQAVGESTGPFLQAVLSQRLGFRFAQTSLVAALLTYALVYLLSCDFKEFFSLKSKKEEE